MPIDPRLRAIFAANISPAAADELTPESTTDTVAGWDSKSFVAIVVAIEAEFGVQFDALDAVRMQSVAAIVEVLAEKGVEVAT